MNSEKMMRSWAGWIALLAVLGGGVLLFQVCKSPKIDLYSGLSEVEANQMLALLTIHKIQASKVSQLGKLTLTVRGSDFVKSVELLRQYGYPKTRFASINDLFPTNQLVSSPSQESAKVTFLKEQRLAEMLSALEGVMEARVSIADPPATLTRLETSPSVACAVYIKHSPETNLENFITQIQSLIKNSIPGLTYENISVVLQSADYRGAVSIMEQGNSASNALLVVPTPRSVEGFGESLGAGAR